MGRGLVVEVRGLDEVLALLDPAIHEKAWRRTINDVTRQSRTAATRRVRQRYTVKSSALKKKLRTRLITAGSRVAKITITGKRLGLFAFAGTRQTKRGVSVKLKRDSPRKVIEHAFVTVVGSSHREVFRRRWRRMHPAAPPGHRTEVFAAMPRTYRLPIEEVTTLCPADMFDHPEVYAEIERVVDEKAPEIYQRHYRFLAERKP